MREATQQTRNAAAACTEPLCSASGASEFYQRHSRPDFIEACYAAAPARVQQALAEELNFLARAIQPPGVVLELGCGNGRVVEALAGQARAMVGIDFLEPYIRQARQQRRSANTALVVARAGLLPFAAGSFDYVLCVQNTLGVMGDEKQAAIAEAVRVTRPGGRIVFMVYSELSVVPRAEWYAEMHRRGMMAPIDWTRSHAELLITEDGHASECFRAERLTSLFTSQGLRPRLERLGDLYWAVTVAKDGTGNSH